MSSNIFHITTRSQLKIGTDMGRYLPVDFDSDGFIHCSFAHQIKEVLDRFYANIPDLVLLEILTKKIDCPVLFENLEGGDELYPHVYCEIPMNAIVRIYPIDRGAAGNWLLPDVIG
jgi:uncharacterized protein (DUF952 family)